MKFLRRGPDRRLNEPLHPVGLSTTGFNNGINSRTISTRPWKDPAGSWYMSGPRGCGICRVPGVFPPTSPFPRPIPGFRDRPMASLPVFDSARTIQFDRVARKVWPVCSLWPRQTQHHGRGRSPHYLPEGWTYDAQDGILRCVRSSPSERFWNERRSSMSPDLIHTLDAS